jgi:hypothetical protein
MAMRLTIELALELSWLRRIQAFASNILALISILK